MQNKLKTNTEKVATNGKLRTTISTGVSKAASLLFYIGMIFTFFTPTKISAEIKTNRQKMIKFGVDVKGLQALISAYLKPNAFVNMTKVQSGLIAYNYLVYVCVTSKMNVVEWYSKIVGISSKYIFNVPKTSPELSVTDQLVVQKSFLSTEVKTTSEGMNKNFLSTVTGWINGSIIKSNLPLLKKLGIGGINLSDMNELVGCLGRDVTSLTSVETEIPQAIVWKNAIPQDGPSQDTIAKTIAKNPEFFMKKTGSTEVQIAALVSEMGNTAKTDFNSTNDATITAVTKLFQESRMTPLVILTLGNSNKTLVAVEAEYTS